jgi:hypothetical protein
MHPGRRRRSTVFYDQTCLCALLPDQVADYEQRLARWLWPAGE